MRCMGDRQQTARPGLTACVIGAGIRAWATVEAAAPGCRDTVTRSSPAPSPQARGSMAALGVQMAILPSRQRAGLGDCVTIPDLWRASVGHLAAQACPCPFQAGLLLLPQQPSRKVACNGWRTTRQQQACPRNSGQPAACGA